MRIITSASGCVDFCNRCAPSEAKAFKLYGDVGEAPDDRGNAYGYDESERPTYDDDPDMVYECDKCGKKLTERNAG